MKAALGMADLFKEFNLEIMFSRFETFDVTKCKSAIVG